MVAFEHHHVLEVAAVHRLVGWVVGYGHLEDEGLVGGLLGAGELVGVDVEQVGVPQKSAAKASKYENILGVLLNDSTALSIWELLVVQLDESPLLLLVVVVEFDGVDVLSSLVSDAAEAVNEPVRERAGTMVVSADVQIWHFKPEVDIRVVHLTLSLGAIFLFSAPSHYNKLFAKPDGRVAMSWVLHRVSLGQAVSVVGLDLP